MDGSDSDEHDRSPDLSVVAVADAMVVIRARSATGGRLVLSVAR